MSLPAGKTTLEMARGGTGSNKQNNRPTDEAHRGQDSPPTTGRQRNAAFRRHRHHAPSPHLQSAEGLDAAFIGVPLDIGTSLRSGTRFGPRQIRAESVMIRPYNMATGAAPFDSLSVADIGDVAINTFNLLDAVRIIEEAYDEIVEHNVIPMTLGGDHTITLPILRALHKKHGKIGLVHIDAHADVNDHMFGEKIAHGTTFRRAVEEGLLDCDRVVQIGLRAQGYTADDFNWSRRQGFRVVQAEECWHKSLEPLMAEVREKSAAARFTCRSTSTASTRPGRLAPAPRKLAA